MVPRPSCRGPMNPLQGSGVSERSRCGAVPILAVAEEPSTGIGRVGALSLWCRAHPCRGRGTLYRDRACRSALAVVPCPSLSVAEEPSTGIGRVGALSLWCRAHPCRSTDEPSTGIGRVGALSLWCRAHPCRGPMNPLQESGVSERSRCGAVCILELADEPSTGIGRVGALSLWCRAHPCRGR